MEGVKPEDFTAVILAAGYSIRFGRPKLLQKLEGLSVISWALRTPLELGMRCVVVLPPDENLALKVKEVLADEMPDLIPLLTYVRGGSTRQESSYRGTLTSSTKYVLVHDAARPFASKELYLRVMRELLRGKVGVVPAVKAYDTVRVEEGQNFRLIPRDKVFLVQTPQGFLREKLLEGHERAMREKKQVTDDAALLEAMGYEITLVEGELINLKLTYKEMLPMFHGIAKALQERRQKTSYP